MIRATPLRARWKLLLVLGTLFVANVLWLASYHVLYVRRIEVRSQRLVENDAALARLRTAVAEEEARVSRLESVSDDRRTLYETILAEEDEKLTRRILRLWELAAASGIRVTSVSFGTSEPREGDVTEYQMSFSTDSSYADLKKLLNAVELDEEFLAVTSLGFARNDPASGRRELGLSVSILTAFHDTGEEPERPRALPLPQGLGG